MKKNAKPELTAKQLWRKTHPDMLPPKCFRDDVTIVLPALGEDENLKTLLPKLQAHYKTCVRDDPGLANAIHAGILESDTELVVVMDADGTHAMGTIHQMVRELDKTGYDIVCGARREWGFGLKDMLSVEGNKLVRKRLDIPITDCTSGFFAARREMLLKLPESVWVGYGDYYMELLAWAVKTDWYIGHVLTDYQPRIAGKGHTSLIKHSMMYLRRMQRVDREIHPSMKLGRRSLKSPLRHLLSKGRLLKGRLLKGGKTTTLQGR